MTRKVPGQPATGQKPRGFRLAISLSRSSKRIDLADDVDRPPLVALRQLTLNLLLYAFDVEYQSGNLGPERIDFQATFRSQLPGG